MSDSDSSEKPGGAHPDQGQGGAVGRSASTALPTFKTPSPRPTILDDLPLTESEAAALAKADSE